MIVLEPGSWPGRSQAMCVVDYRCSVCHGSLVWVQDKVGQPVLYVGSCGKNEFELWLA